MPSTPPVSLRVSETFSSLPEHLPQFPSKFQKTFFFRAPPKVSARHNAYHQNTLAFSSCSQYMSYDIRCQINNPSLFFLHRLEVLAKLLADFLPIPLRLLNLRKD